MLDPQVGKSVVDPSTVITVQELLWYNCSQVCGSSSQWLCGGANGDLLQEGLCHKLHLPGRLQSESLSPWQATVNPCLCWRLLDTHRHVWLSLLWGNCSFLLHSGAHKVLFVPSKCLFPQSCGISAVKSHWPSKSNSWGFSALLLDPQVGKSVVGPKTFATV